MKICGLILAAGSSSRLGRPKQLVRTGGRTLLEKAIETALAANLNPVHVVLGARFEQIKASIEHFPLSIIENEQWQEGIGSSIRTGIRSVIAEGKYDAVLLMLCDQLHVDAPHLQALIDAYQNKQKLIIATAYGAQIGVPALFDQKYFPLLKELSGDEGAKKIIKRHSAEVHSLKFEQAIVDVDTPEDLLKTGLT